MHRPRPRYLACLIALLLVASTIVLGVAGSRSGDDAPGAATATDGTGTMPDGPVVLQPYGFDVDTPPRLTQEPPFALETGRIPTQDEALGFAARYRTFHAIGTEGLDELAREGHLKGSGTKGDPYVLERFYVEGDLVIESADRPIIIRNGYVSDQFRLNYVGEAVYVHHVYATDLRVNENIERNGTNTGGLFHDNHFGFVGQIRHFTGTFRHNQVGPVPTDVVRSFVADTGIMRLSREVVFNFDGFHGAHVHNNTFIGQVDIKLHGHNHGDCFECGIHDHGDPEQEAHDEAVAKDGGPDHVPDGLGFRSRHSIRYHSLAFEDNEIRAPVGTWYALRYNDLAHAGDDQTAASEPNLFLEDDHVHYQDITIRRNTLAGPLLVEVFNAEDDRHVAQNRGILRIEDNRITVTYENRHWGGGDHEYGMWMHAADGIELRVIRNTIGFQAAQDELSAIPPQARLFGAPTLTGLHLEHVDHGNLTIAYNTVTSGDLGLFARFLGEHLYWALDDNDFRTRLAWRGDEIANGPGETETQDAEDDA